MDLCDLNPFDELEIKFGTAFQRTRDHQNPLQFVKTDVKTSYSVKWKEEKSVNVFSSKYVF